MSNEMMRVSPYELTRQKMDSMLKALPGEETYLIQRFRQAMLSMANSPGLSKCTPDSVVKSLYACVRLGLIPDPVLQHVAVVPFKNNAKGIHEATLIPMYKGLIELAKRAESRLYLSVGTVYSNDEYEYVDGLNLKFNIVKRWWEKGDMPGEPVFSYCISGLPDEQKNLEVVSAREGRKIGGASKAGMKPGTPWHDHFERMCEKTAVRRASRLWRLDPEKESTRRLREAMSIEEPDVDDLISPPEEGELLSGEENALPEGTHKQSLASKLTMSIVGVMLKRGDKPDDKAMVKALRSWALGGVSNPTADEYRAAIDRIVDISYVDYQACKPPN